ncbi:hypothetical protein B484DRAFT_404821, partial [Ochromonadaceae sp. CCMP2298]
MDPSTWPRFFVEFRGLNPAFRFDEFRDAATCVLPLLEEPISLEAFDPKNIVFTPAIPDISGTVECPTTEWAICCYVRLPSEEAAVRIASRCSMLRRIVEVWGEGLTVAETSAQAVDTFPSLVAPLLARTSNNSWRCNFMRYGREGKSGLDYRGKQELLAQYAPLFKLLNSTVDFKAPTHELLHFEDWHTYQQTFNDRVVELKRQRKVLAEAALASAASASTSASASPDSDGTESDTEV